MAVTFYNCQTKINTTGVLAESASIEISNSLTPAFALGYRGVCDQPPSGPLKTTISFDYFLKTDLEPNYAVSSGLRTYISESPVAVAVGGLVGVGYLERYSVRGEPNQVIKASASYICFTPLAGKLQDKLLNLNYSGTNPTGIAHGWTVSPTESSTTGTLGFSYEFAAKWEPVYGIGAANPVSVLFNGGQETFSFTRDTFMKPTFSGVDAATFMVGTNGTNFNVKSLNVFCNHPGNSINFDLSNAKITSSSVSAQTKDIVRTNTVLTRYF